MYPGAGARTAAAALHAHLLHNGGEIAALLTTITQGYDQISMHGVRRSLLSGQARSLGYPLEEVFIPRECTDQEYERRMGTALERFGRLGVGGVVFGDLFLEDVRKYREERLGRIGMKGIFPNWGTDTTELAQSLMDSGFRAIVVCVNTEALGRDFVGREYNAQFLSDLPPSVDPCGENGEFHTFVFDGPLFSEPIEFELGEKVLRGGQILLLRLAAVPGRRSGQPSAV